MCFTFSHSLLLSLSLSLSLSLYVLRRKEDVVNPKLFEIAASGNSDLLYQLLEDGDDVNPYVSRCINFIEKLLVFCYHLTDL